MTEKETPNQPKTLQKQLALAMQEMIKNTGVPLMKTVQTLRQVINFSIAMAKDGYKEDLKNIQKTLSLLITENYMDSFEDPEVVCSKEELLFRIQIEDIYGDVSIIINDQRLIPASMMGEERLRSPSMKQEQEEIF